MDEDEAKLTWPDFQSTIKLDGSTIKLKGSTIITIITTGPSSTSKLFDYNNNPSTGIAGTIEPTQGTSPGTFEIELPMELYRRSTSEITEINDNDL